MKNRYEEYGGRVIDSKRGRGDNLKADIEIVYVVLSSGSNYSRGFWIVCGRYLLGY